MQTQAARPPKAGRKEWIGLAVIALACVLYVMDLTVLHLAVPAISRDLHPGSAELLWIIDIYGFLVAGSLITLGTLGQDRPAALADDRRLRIRCCVRGRRVLDQHRDAHRHQSGDGHRRGHPGAIDPVADP